MRYRILAIDDEPQVLDVVKAAVKSQGWEFRGAESGEAGIKAASRWTPHLVLLDVQLPDLDGWEVCRKLRGMPSLKEVPILLMSGKHKDSEAILKGLEAGADDYLPKPLGLGKLVAEIQLVLGSPADRPSSA